MYYIIKGCILIASRNRDDSWLVPVSTYVEVGMTVSVPLIVLIPLYRVVRVRVLFMFGQLVMEAVTLTPALLMPMHLVCTPSLWGQQTNREDWLSTMSSALLRWQSRLVTIQKRILATRTVQ